MKKIKRWVSNLLNEYEVKKEDSSVLFYMSELEQRINVLEQKYSDSLFDIKRLEEENIETSNTLYELMHSIEAVDARIDIIVDHCDNKNYV